MFISGSSRAPLTPPPLSQSQKLTMRPEGMGLPRPENMVR